MTRRFIAILIFYIFALSGILCKYTFVYAETSGKQISQQFNPESKTYSPIISTPKDKREMVYIPSRSSSKLSSARPFYIDKYEVTFGDFSRFVKESGYQIVKWDLEEEEMRKIYSYKGSFDNAMSLEDYIENIDKYGIRKMSIICLSLEDASAYAKWAGKRIPTEEEWMLAAGGKNHYKYAWGKSFSNKVKDMFYDLGLKKEKLFEKMPFPSDSLERAFDRTDWGNRFIYGMGTQPMEWTVTKKPDKKKAVVEYIIKGAMYNPAVHYFEYEMRNTERNFGKFYDRFSAVGFRCVLDAEKVKN